MASSSSSFDRNRMALAAAGLAQRGVFVGTSSWKYPGWRGMLYDDARYTFRGKFSEKRLEEHCLGEYAEVFKTVCVDAAYYKFPDRCGLAELIGQTPPDFLFGFKVTDEITLKSFTNLPRFGPRAGKPNGNFLNADLFASAFIRPCEEFRKHVGLVMFEFSHFYPADFLHVRDFLEALDGFLEKIPEGWPYGVEIRNKHFLGPDYFAILRQHQVAHVFNSWAEMPPVGEQMDMAGSMTHPTLCGARFLLKPGRKYQEAVDLFRPYDQVREPSAEARAAGVKLIKEGAAERRRQTFVFVNNRLEGNALATIEAMVEEAGFMPPAGAASATASQLFQGRLL